MSTDASILAIGPFQRELALAGHYERPSDSYAEVREGTILPTEFGSALLSGRSAVEAVADVLSVNLGDFNTFQIDAKKVDPLDVERLIWTDDLHEGLVKEFAGTLAAFARAGFQLHFRLD